MDLSSFLNEPYAINMSRYYEYYLFEKKKKTDDQQNFLFVAFLDVSLIFFFCGFPFFLKYYDIFFVLYFEHILSVRST